MTKRRLLCTQCGAPVVVIEDVYGHIEWGPAIIGEDGIVRPEHPDPRDDFQTVVYDGGISGIRACCTNDNCEYQWRLRRRFDPVTGTEGEE